MGKGRPRSVQKGVSNASFNGGSLNIPSGPVFYPNEDEFKDPLEYIYRIRPKAEPFGICRIVPPKGWEPPFNLDLNSFTFPTKNQAIHQLQARSAACDLGTFELEYSRFLEEHCGRKKKKVVFDGEELDLCKLFNGVKRFGGYDKVVKEKKWGEVWRFAGSVGRISECSKHVLCQLYREHLYDYESYYNWLNHERDGSFKKGMVHRDRKKEVGVEFSSSKRRRRNGDGERVKGCKVEKKEVLDQICEQCQSGLHGEVMLLCDRCDRGWHIYCLSPPLKRVPVGNWYCLECLNSDEDSFGFVPGKRFALEAFRRMADRAKKKWFGSSSASRLQIEKKFWEIVEGSVGEVEVMYGSDLDTSVYGSGFPRPSDQRPASVEADVWEKYCSSPWNLNNLPTLKGSMLQAVHNSIAGVMVPWLYVGMLFSSFCWHFEDHCFYSMNYLHWGEPKCWYSVPGSEAPAFEKVMRKCLPDLFDAQPDLLFQLVTMLNPSVLQENGVPVYTVLQEPGNFVITFPRSFHGGFNFGLNCAEAVNFAPADWLPHGGVGAGLYQQYHKAAVLSHEELVCVAAKGDCDKKASPYLKKELLRIYTKEKTWRERLWRNGIVNSSLMSPRKHPEYVGTEEDPTCIICHQYLYLSSVACHCRPSAFVCLEHWEHLCECNASKHSLLYRYTLAELKDLVLMMDNSDDTSLNRSLRSQLSGSNESSALIKKAKSSHVSLVQLAEEWLLSSCKLFQIPFSCDAYVKALKVAEQFLWAGSEMDPVRDVARKLIEAKNWAQGIRDCLSKVEKSSLHGSGDLEKVQLEDVDKLINFDPLPCNEPVHLKLKGFADVARALTLEIDSVFSTCSTVTISELEDLYAKAHNTPIYIKGIEKLTTTISSAKVWVANVQKCISEKCPASIEINTLCQLKSEMLELQVQLPNEETFLDLLRQAESCGAQCSEILKGPINLKKLEALLQEFGSFTVNIPKLKLLRQHHCNAMSWVSRFRDILVNIHEREDQDCVVNELTCILNDGTSLKIQVDELPLVEIELKKACCRQKALKARDTKMCLDFIQQVMIDAVKLQIDGESLFTNIFGVLTAAICWEERAKVVLSSNAQMLEFEDVIRASDEIFVILPSLSDIKEAVSEAKLWVKTSMPFLLSAFSSRTTSRCLSVESLKELVSQSKLLKVSLGERAMLQNVLKKCTEWELDACSVLQDAERVFSVHDARRISNDLISEIEQVLTATESVRTAGVALGFGFSMIPELETASSGLRWGLKALSFCSVVPSLEETESLLENAEQLSVSCASRPLWSVLVDGVNWVKKVLEVTAMPCNQRCKLSDAEEVLLESRQLKVSFPVMVDQLMKAIKKHRMWQEQVCSYFSSRTDKRPWSRLLELKELGNACAFGCSELDMVTSEIKKIKGWKLRCKNIFGFSPGDLNSLFSALLKIQHSLDRSLYIYDQSKGCKARERCMCCSGYFEDQGFLTCSTCKDCYHLRCLGQTLSSKDDTEEYVCTYCLFMESGSISWNGGGPLKFGGKRPELKMLVVLLSDAENFSAWIEERDILQKLMEQALKCKSCLTEILDFILAYHDNDLDLISMKLATALKAVEVAGLYDHQGSRKLELALASYSWKVRANKLLEGPQKPLIQHIQRHLKEGSAINISADDYFWQELVEMKNIGMQWADTAKQVAMDSGELELDEVFTLIKEGENLPVHFAKELELLRERSVLYCICRKPYDQRAMIACDQCDEWYHFDCIKLCSLPKIYICPACRPQTGEFPVQLNLERSMSSKFEEPQTPSPQCNKLKRRPKRSLSEIDQQMGLSTSTDGSNTERHSTGIDLLLWRNRKPFRRAARKRVELESLSPFFHIQQ